MPSHFGIRILLISSLCAVVLVGCSEAPKTTKPVRTPTPYRSDLAVAGIRASMEQLSRSARSLSATGDIAIEQDGESHSASFLIKNKRLDGDGNRVDSLSLEISGPFGIKVARFLASPEKYEFYDILHDQTLSGRTDRKSIEDLTHLNGISLQDMSDLIYGVVRMDAASGDSVELYSDNANRVTLVVRTPGISTSVYDFRGVAADGSASGQVTLARYRRWLGTPETLNQPPALSVQFLQPALIHGVSIPQHIEATAGNNKLTLDYDHIELNPSSLIVRIKMP